MKICPNCSYQNRNGILFCEDCGQDLSSTAVSVTPITTREFVGDKDRGVAKATWGTASLSRSSSVVLQIKDAKEPIPLDFERSITLGRADETSTTKPGLDLTPYGALEMGVSRKHAIIERTDDVLTLVDMDSSNGTHLNGQRLVAEQPRVIRDGGEIRLGK